MTSNCPRGEKIIVCNNMLKNIKVLNSQKIVSEKLVDYLKRHPEMDKRLLKNSQRKFFTTDCTIEFENIGKKFLKRK